MNLYLVTVKDPDGWVNFAGHWLAATPADAKALASAQYMSDLELRASLNDPPIDACTINARKSYASRANAMNQGAA